MSARVIHLLRHGPPLRTGLMLGHTDEPAMAADCPLMRGKVQPLAIAQVVSSDLVRATEQARTLANDHTVPLTLDPAWRELDFGEWDGRSADTIEQPDLARFWDDPNTNPPPGGERWADLCSRVAAALDRVQDRTLVVTHAGAMRAAFSVLTGLDHRGVWALDLPYRALLSLRIWPGSPISGHVIGLDTGVPG